MSQPEYFPVIADPERVAQLIAHRACIGMEHDPANGKLHGYCVVCGVPWPCDYAGKPPTPSPTEGASSLADARPELVEKQTVAALGSGQELRERIEALPTERGSQCMNSSEYLLKSDVRAALALPLAPKVPDDEIKPLVLALRAADDALSTWFSSEYCESAVAKMVRKALNDYYSHNQR